MEEEKLRKRKQRAKKDGNIKQLAEIVKELGDLYFESKKMDEALEEYEEQLKLCEILNDPLNTAVAHRMIGEIHTDCGNYEEALSHLSKYLQGVKETKNLIEQQRAYATLGRMYFCMSEACEKTGSEQEPLAAAKRAYSKSLKLCDKLEENKDIKEVEVMMMRARLLLNLGLVLEVQKKLDEAIELIEKAAQLCNKHKLNEDLYRIHIALAAVHERQENYDDAFNLYDLAIKLAHEPEKKASARISRAELLIKMGEWSEARQILVSLYVNRKKVPSLSPTIEKLLRIVVVIDKYELDLRAEEDNEKRMTLYENLGDAASAGGSYEKAVEFYKGMLLCAEKKPGDNRSNVSAALVSLGRTLKDAKQFEEACIYARSELKLCDENYREACRSALFLAELLSSIKHTPIIESETREAYQLALTNASKSSDQRLKLAVLEETQAYYNEIGSTEEASEMNDEIETLRASIIDYESPIISEGEENNDVGKDIDLDELSDVEAELHKDDKSKGSRRSSRRGFVIKRNEKGETKLHVACINNNIQEVVNLLAAGHPVDVRDHMGWTPLHEAANYGHIEIVQLLIDHGANVNDPGGPKCGNITPLHDAASCGHFSVMNLLIKHGADITLKSKEGESILDIFETWRSRLEGERKKGKVDWTDADEQEYQFIRDRLRRVLPTKPTKAINEPLIDEDICSQATVDFKEDEFCKKSPKKISAGEDYRRTIESLKNRNYLNQSYESASSKTVNSKVTPLIDSEQQLVDDWLEDDLSAPATSSSLKRASSFTKNTSQINQLSIQKFTNDVDIIKKSNLNIESINFKIIIENMTINLKLKRPDESNYLYNNLINDITKHINQNTGCIAKLILTTVNDEELQPENLLNLVYTNQNDFINSEILRLKGEDEDIEMIALLKSLEYEKNLKVLELSSCSLFGHGELLNYTLNQLKQLQELHLSGCDIDSECIKKLDSLPSQLRILNLSCNPLNTESQTKLRDLITSLYCLQDLNLHNCKLKELEFNSTNTISANLVSLDLSWNKMYDNEVDYLLQRQLVNLNLSQTTRFPIVNNEINLMAYATLENLELAGCNLTDSDVIQLLTNCRNLSKIILNNNSQVTSIALESLLAYKPTLSLIDTTGCQKIDNFPNYNLVIGDPSVCTLKTSMTSDVCDSWEKLWYGRAKQFKMPHDILIFKINF
ncbi:Similar to CG7457: Tonsoku-like protein (Drosophila melanogaster) [Cotesia congregata]|uniref:Similar to CG7457: Tonsoku-like protein (Drosophila melanogaster) n=1 Tax=Cotesia congregata TaxID=51543 RepID=A0A8J2HCB7_COTCN|nr:Similar to CG7457: Tonsoku-like protein (Drosophila melanogaster) [Cotesia congregata]